MKEVDNLILGGGISGISASYHIGHEHCLILEKESHSLGILKSKDFDGFTWDLGPHVSFTKHDYVKNLFSKNVNEEFFEHAVFPKSYYKNIWINHPVQSNLYQLPEDIKKKCIDSFLQEREKDKKVDQISNYSEWLDFSLGKEISSRFVAPYTRKYWTVDPRDLSTDWIGPRMHVPKKEEFLRNAEKKNTKSTHYITKVRYPKRGGYESFVKPMTKNANILNNHEITSINLKDKIVRCKNNKIFTYKNLISSIPLPIFIKLSENLRNETYEAAKKLNCSKLLLVNVEIPHPSKSDAHWLYVYDEKMYTTRVTLMDNLSHNNCPKGKSGAQVEVYFSEKNPPKEDYDAISKKVLKELYQIGLIEDCVSIEDVKYHNVFLEYANIIFDHERKQSLDTIFKELSKFGYKRNDIELNPTTDWSNETPAKGSLNLIGRFGEWKYFWSDDCVMAGKTYEGYSS